MARPEEPTSSELAELTAPLNEESQTEKLLRKSKDQPFVPLGILGTVGALIYGAYSYKNRGPMSTSRYIMRLRVVAQSMVVGAIIVGVGFAALRDSKEEKK